jgi:hypothetical protein
MIYKLLLPGSLLIALLSITGCGDTNSNSANVSSTAGTSTPTATATSTTETTATPVSQTSQPSPTSTPEATKTSQPSPTSTPETKKTEATAPSLKPVRVKFAAGASSTTIKNSVVRSDRNTYLLGAKSGQQMNLKITSLENNAVFDVVSPDGKTVKQEATTWSGKLPANGDYQIIVGGTRGNATYELTVEIK